MMTVIIHVHNNCRLMSLLIRITVDLVIFACFNFREFLIFGLLMQFKIREF